MSSCSTTRPQRNRGGFVDHLSWTQAAQQSVTRIIVMDVMNSVTPKAAPKHDLLFNKPASERFKSINNEAPSLTRCHHLSRV